MKGYGQFCPVAKSSEVLAERWTPLVLRELLSGSHTFNDLQRGVPLMSRSLLSKRLKDLERIGVVERRLGERSHTYHLTEAGEELRPIIIQMGVWGQRWARNKVEPDDLDPTLLMWDMHRGLDAESLPSQRVVVQFDFTDVAKAPLRRTWLVIDGQEVDVCYKDPGFQVDLNVMTSLRTMTMVWMGDISFAEAVSRGGLEVRGPAALKRAFPRWLKLSAFADVERPARLR